MGGRGGREKIALRCSNKSAGGASLQRLTPDVTLIDSGIKIDWTGIPFRYFYRVGRDHADGDRLGTARRGEEEED